MRILLVEDNVVNAEITRKMVQGLGHNLAIAGTGYEALDLLRTEPFDLILMDCQLPELDGYETTQAIRRSYSHNFHDITIVALTSRIQTGEREKCFSAGMDGYLTKPVTASILDLAIDHCFSVKNSSVGWGEARYKARMRSILALLIFVCVNQASAAYVIPSPQCACDKADKYDQPSAFSFGRFSGKCVDTCKFRGAVILKSNERHIQVANVFHHGKFWTADIEPANVKEVDIAFERFVSIISHVFIRFKFNKPIEVRSQTGRGVDRIQDVILSAEGTPPAGMNYKFLESSTGDYLLTYRVLSGAEAYERMVLRKGHSIKQYQLNLAPKEMQTLLRDGLKASVATSFQAAYQLLSNNCSTSAVALIEGACHSRLGAGNVLDTLESRLPIEGPFSTLSLLEKHGLIGAALPNFESEALLAQP